MHQAISYSVKNLMVHRRSYKSTTLIASVVFLLLGKTHLQCLYNCIFYFDSVLVEEEYSKDNHNFVIPFPNWNFDNNANKSTCAALAPRKTFNKLLRNLNRNNSLCIYMITQWIVILKRMCLIETFEMSLNSSSQLLVTYTFTKIYLEGWLLDVSTRNKL